MVNPPHNMRKTAGTDGTILMLTTLAAYDGNIFMLSASGAIFHPGVLISTALFSIAGAGAWVLASMNYSRASRASDPRLNAEFWRACFLSMGSVTLACAIGRSLPQFLQLHTLPVLGGIAVGMVGLCIVAKRDVPASRILGGEVVIPTALIAIGVLADTVLTLRTGVNVQASPFSPMATLVGASVGFLTAAVAWCSIVLATHLPAQRYLHPDVLRVFGGLAVLIIALSIAGVDVAHAIFSPRLADFSSFILLAMGLLASFIARAPSR